MAEKKNNWHLMLFVDNKKQGGVHQMGINRGVVEVLAIIIAAALIITGAGWFYNSSAKNTLNNENESLKQQVESLSSDVERLSAENTALSDKVSILSNTVNTKVELETAAQKESDQAHYPSGFPLSSSASMTTSEDDPNCLIFTCNEGTSIIATGDGTVLEVLPDTDYGHCIRIDHENGYVTEYYMASAPLIREGDAVLQGAILSLVESNKSKVAYKIFLDGKETDPQGVISIDG